MTKILPMLVLTLQLKGGFNQIIFRFIFLDLLLVLVLVLVLWMYFNSKLYLLLFIASTYLALYSPKMYFLLELMESLYYTELSRL